MQLKLNFLKKHVQIKHCKLLLYKKNEALWNVTGKLWVGKMKSTLHQVTSHHPVIIS